MGTRTLACGKGFASVEKSKRGSAQQVLHAHGRARSYLLGAERDTSNACLRPELLGQVARRPPHAAADVQHLLRRRFGPGLYAPPLGHLVDEVILGLDEVLSESSLFFFFMVVSLFGFVSRGFVTRFRNMCVPCNSCIRLFYIMVNRSLVRDQWLGYCGNSGRRRG